MTTNKLKCLCILIISVVFLNGCGTIGVKVNNLIPPQTSTELPKVDNLNHLKELLKSIEPQVNILERLFSRGKKSSEAVGGDGSGNYGSRSNESADYSSTNVQVKGVDESDIVKTDGRYIYRVNEEKIVLVDAIDPQNMKQLPGVLFKGSGFTPTQMYLDKDHLVVIGTYSNKEFYRKMPEFYLAEIDRPHYYNYQTGIKIYDIRDQYNIKELREIIVEGTYVSSRKIGNDIYFVANRDINYHYLKGAKKEYGHIPLYWDNTLGEEAQIIPLKDIQYFPDNIDNNYVMVVGLSLEDLKKPVNINTYLGSGKNIYSSLERLYIATTNNDQKSNHTTTIYSFELDNGRATFSKTGKVKGRILNQFSMDEYNGYFRIATTTGDIWRDDEGTSKNHVYILNQDLEEVGKVEDIAPTERIYSMRFMGEKGYMVTFRETDPFFVIDLEDPVDPKVLGYLKIPGYSDYLHPYDENHIIGVGKEVHEDKYGNFLNGGVKVAIFDVSDFQNPKEKFKIEIGDRGTDTPLSYDHKALLFSKEKNLFTFPIRINNANGFTFQGAYVYEIDMENGLTLKNTITHITDEEYMKAGGNWYYSRSNVDRLIYIKDVLYSLSQNKVKSFNLKNHELIGGLELQ